MIEVVGPLPKPQSHKWFGWKRDKGDPKDRPYMRPKAMRLPASDWLSPAFMPSIRDQGAQGSCTGHMARSMAQFLRAVGAQPSLELSPAFAYLNGRVIEGTVKDDAGCEIRDVVKGLAKVGIASEKDCPYVASKLTTAASKAAYKNALQDVIAEYQRVDTTAGAAATLAGLKSCIHSGMPVGFGFSVFESFDAKSLEDRGLMPMQKGSMQGGHAVWIVGYDNDQKVLDQTGAFLIANSWGTAWGCKHPKIPGGARGYFHMPYNYIANADLCADFWALKRIT